MDAPTVLVAFAPGFEEIEAFVPVDLLRRAGAEVTTAGVGSQQVTSSHGVTVVCDTEISQAPVKFDCVVCPGGMPGSVNLAHSWPVMQRLVAASEQGLVCAICAAPAVVLGPAGLLDGHKAVCYPGMESSCPTVQFSDEPVMVDGNVITARGAGCAMEFALAIVSKLFGQEKADEIARNIVLR